MANPKEQVQIQLTPEQQAEIKVATGQDVEVLDLSVSELEERIAPTGIALGHHR